MKRNTWLLRSLKFLVFATLFVAAIGYFTMWLWNSLIPELFHGPALSYWQAVGLLVLSRIFFGGFRGGRPGGWSRHREAWRRKIAGRLEAMSPEEQEKFRQKMRTSCGPAWMRRREEEHAPTP